MASSWAVNFSKCSASLFIFRHLKLISGAQKFLHFSTSSLSACKNTAPVKFTTNKAAEVPIRDLIGLKQPVSDNKPAYEKHIILFSLVVFLVYFCIIREENDIDDALKSPSESNIKAAELLNLKIKLLYCQKNNLPTDALKAKIEELEKDQKYTSPFAK